MTKSEKYLKAENRLRQCCAGLPPGKVFPPNCLCAAEPPAATGLSNQASHRQRQRNTADRFQGIHMRKSEEYNNVKSEEGYQETHMTKSKKYN